MSTVTKSKSAPARRQTGEFSNRLVSPVFVLIVSVAFFRASGMSPAMWYLLCVADSLVCGTSLWLYYDETIRCLKQGQELPEKARRRRLIPAAVSSVFPFAYAMATEFLPVAKTPGEVYAGLALLAAAVFALFILAMSIPDDLHTPLICARRGLTFPKARQIQAEHACGTAIHVSLAAMAGFLALAYACQMP